MNEAPTSDAAPQGEERPSRRLRSAIRLRARAKVECRVGLTGMSANIATGLVNVSSTGALLTVRSPVDLERAVELRLSGPEDRQSVIVVARVARCDPAQSGEGYYLGVRFEKPLHGPELNRLVHSGDVQEG